MAEAAPELVALDAEGKPYSVRYHVLPSLLLNEMQKQQRTIEEQQQRAEEQGRTIENQRAQLGLESERIGAQEAQIATLLARLDEVESQLRRDRTGANQ